MNLIIADRDEDGKPVVRQEKADLATMSEPSAIFWETRKALRGRKSTTPGERRAFVENCRKWFAALD
jgi:hypothetical protein